MTKDKFMSSAVLNDVIEALEKKYGEELWLDTKKLKTYLFKTGSRILDSKIGGGIKNGSIVEFFGESQTAKSTMALKTIAEAQKDNKFCVWIDAEKRLSSEWVTKCGVDASKLKIIRDCNGERVMNKVSALITTGQVDLIVVDSVGALVPTVETEKGMEEAIMGVHARMLNRALRTILANNNVNNPTTIIFINHFYMTFAMYGAPKETKGGKELKYLSSLRIEFKKGEKLEESGEQYGHNVIAIIVKNDFGFPGQRTEFGFNFKTAMIDTEDDVFNMAVAKEIFKKAGPYIVYGKQKFHGKAECKKWLKDNYKEIEEKLNAK